MKFSPAKAIRLRNGLGMSQRHAARTAGLSRQALANIESGESTPRMETITVLAATYGVSFEALVIHDEPDGNGSARAAEETTKATPTASRR